MGTMRLLLEYDGTPYVGWQRQPNGLSVQEELERALAQILREPVGTVAAGRTDAGVHARGQVVSFRCAGDPDPVSLRRSLNGVLPGSIAVREAARAEDDFHARYSAVGRRYRYTIHRGPTALDRATCWQVFASLDVGVMEACASELPGEHDFTSFCKADADVNHHRCTVLEAGWTESGPRLVFDIEANRFLYGMVRALVGTMVDAGRGRIGPEDFRRVLAARDRSAAGLVLEAIRYPATA